MTKSLRVPNSTIRNTKGNDMSIVNAKAFVKCWNSRYNKRNNTTQPQYAPIKATYIAELDCIALDNGSKTDFYQLAITKTDCTSGLSANHTDFSLVKYA